MEGAVFRSRVEKAFASLQSEISAFNAWWPLHIVAGQVWQLLSIPGPGAPGCKPSKGITVVAAAPENMIDVAQKAIAALLLEPLQDPKTTLRVPGWVALNAEPTAHVERINQARNTLSDILDAEMEANYSLLAPTTRMNHRGKLLREIIHGVSMRHTFRKLHAFDKPPLVMSFIWVDSSTSHTRTSVKTECARLNQLVDRKAHALNIPCSEVPLNSVLEELRTHKDDVELVIVRSHAPHPRVLVHYEKRGRYDAMPHANLPMFFYNPNGDELPKIKALPSYEPSDAKPPRGRKGTSMTLLNAREENRKVYLAHKNPKSATSPRLQADVVSTYGS